MTIYKGQPQKGQLIKGGFTRGAFARDLHRGRCRAYIYIYIYIYIRLYKGLAQGTLPRTRQRSACPSQDGKAQSNPQCTEAGKHQGTLSRFSSLLVSSADKPEYTAATMHVPNPGRHSPIYDVQVQIGLIRVTSEARPSHVQVTSESRIGPIYFGRTCPS